MYRELVKLHPEDILVYLRKSRSDDPALTVEETLQKHESIVQKWMDQNLDAPIPEENWYREVASGGDTIASRPEFQKVLKRIESKNIKAVFVVDCSRLGRPDLEEIGKISKLFRYTNTFIITEHRMFDLNEEYDKEQFERELMRGNDYLEYFKKIQKRGIQISVEDGNYLGTYAPYGYNKIMITVNKKKCPTLEINEDEAKVVRMIFDWYGNEGIGASRICNRLNEMGIKTKNGKFWKPATIKTMLDNEHYIGKIRYYYRIANHTVVDQEIVKGTVRNQEYQLHEGKHDAIVDEELFYRIKNKRATMPKYRVNTTLQNPLSSLIYCKCGSCMSYKKFRGKPRYICEEQRFCHSSAVSYEDIISSVCDSLMEYIKDFELKAETTDESIYEKHKEQIALLEKKLVETEQKEISIWEKYSEEGMPKMVFDKLREKCEEDKKTLKNALEKAYKDAPTKIDYEEKILRFHEVIDSLRDDTISAESKNKLVRTIIKRITYDRPKSIRMSKEEAEKLGLESVNGWARHDFILDVETLV